VTQKVSLSIIIPVYNEEDHIGACLKAIQTQTDMPDEVLVIDNGCTDKTIAIAKTFSFVKVIKEDRPSVLYARNTGFDAAKSELIARIDADTLLAPDWMQRAKEIMADSQIYAATGPDAIYDMPLPRGTRWLHDVLLRIAVFGNYHFLTGSNMVIRRSVWEAVRSKLCEDLTIFEDTDLAIHMQRSGMTPTYTPKLWASVSSRRFSDSPSHFIKYMQRHSRTHTKHGLREPGVYFAQFAYGSTYIIGKFLERFFDPKTRRFGLKHPTRAAKRIDPMNGRTSTRD
jgi:glycosyltransferase involved in cell wall biosynthesis